MLSWNANSSSNDKSHEKLYIYPNGSREKVKIKVSFTLHGWVPQTDVEELKAGPIKPTALPMSIEDLQYMESNKQTNASVTCNYNNLVKGTAKWS